MKISEIINEDKKYSRMSMFNSKPLIVSVIAEWHGIMHDESIGYKDDIEKISDYYSPYASIRFNGNYYKKFSDIAKLRSI